MPPVQRAVGEAPLTASSAVFARDLAGRRAPDPMLAPLGHDVTADGPAGLVSGIAVPLVQHVPSGADQASTTTLPSPAASRRGRSTVQRAMASVANLPPGDVAYRASGGSPLQGSADLGGSDDAAAAGTAAGQPPADILGLAPRTLPVAELVTAAPAISATRVADATAPAPVLALARIVASGPAAQPSAGASVSGRTDAAGAGNMALPVQRSASTDVTGPAPGSVSGSVAATPPVLPGGDDLALPVVARRTLGESRRLGLGAPLTGRPPSAAPDAGRSALPVARLVRSVEAPGSTSAQPPTVLAPPAAAAASAPYPRLVVARRSTTAPAIVLPSDSPADPAAGNPGRADAPAEASAEGVSASPVSGAAGSTRPLVGDAPIGVSRLAQADAATDADADEAEPDVAVLRLAGTPGSAPDVMGVPATHGAAGQESAPPGAAVIDAPGDRAAAGDRAATRESATSASLAVVQRNLAMPAGSEASRAAGALPVTRTSPALAPLVAGRAMRASQPTAMATLGYGPAAEPAPVVARLAIPSFGTGAGGSDARSFVFDAAGRSPAPPVSVAAAGRDERPVVSRASLAAGRGPTAATLPTLPLIRSAVGTAERDAVETGRPGGVVSWAAGDGFTSVGSPSTPSVQRAVVIDEVNVTPGSGAAGPAGSGSAAGSAGQPGAAGPGGAGTDYEELAEHVYDKIRARLTTELLLDRERAGMLVDV